MSRSNPASLIAAILVSTAVSNTQAAPKFGVMGDSLSDEYLESSYGAYADNWVEQLVTGGIVDAGPLATGGGWGEPRRSGYKYNWARDGSTSNTLLSAGQHTGLAWQGITEGIDYAVLMIGANDQFVATGGTSASFYFNVYQGNWSPAQIDNWIDGVVANIDTALSALPNSVDPVLVGVPDYGVTPDVQAGYTNAAGRQAVQDVLSGQLNARIEEIAQARQLPFVDILGATTAIFGTHAVPNLTVDIGNVAIELTQTDTPSNSNPTAAFVHDGVHPHTTLQGTIANVMVAALNKGYGAGLTPLSEQQILANAGLAYGGVDTLQSQIGLNSNYVTDYSNAWIYTGASGSSGAWTDDANWMPTAGSSTGPPNNGSASVMIKGSSSGGWQPNVDQPWSIEGLTFVKNPDGNFSYTVSGSRLTVASGGIDNTSGAPQTITSEVSIVGNQDWYLGGLTSMSTGPSSATARSTSTAMVSWNSPRATTTRAVS